MSIDTDIIVRTRMQCGKCSETFPEDFERCPKCGSGDFVGYTVTNPIARLPMEAILRLVAHILWIAGTLACVALLWSTNSPDTERNLVYMFSGFGVLLVSIVLSIGLFGLGEMLKRTIRIQRRLRAMFEETQSHNN